MLAKIAGGKRMANQEHLEILKQGVFVWNKWRDVQKNIRPDLNEVDLSNTNLRGAILIEADLSNANLKGADLSRTFLRGAFLRGADLSQVDLSRADLGETNL